MAFREHLQEICSAVEGVFVCSMMGFDGIAIDTVENYASGLDVPTLLIEYSSILNQVRAAAGVLQSDRIEELVISTDKVTVMSRAFYLKYFLVLALTGDANWGKSRYMMRIVAPRLKAEL